MRCFYIVPCVFYYITLSNAVSVKIDGLIDLGPRWDYKYRIINSAGLVSIFPVKVREPTEIPRTLDVNRNTDESHSDSEKSDYPEDNMSALSHPPPPTEIRLSEHNDKTEIDNTDTQDDPGMNILMAELNETAIASIPLKIMNNSKIKNFITHLYRQNHAIFDDLKSKTNDNIVKKQIHFLTKNYDKKFKEFIESTMKQNIRTRIGSQKVMLNTIDVSNKILTRLVNFLVADMDKKGILRSNIGTSNLFLKEIDRQTNLEYAHVCNKYGICRTSVGLTEFLSDAVTTLLKTDDEKFKLAVNSFTEALKNADFSKSLDEDKIEKLHSGIDWVERADVVELRVLLLIFKNILAYKNKPFVVMERVQPRMNQTVSLLELLDTLNEAFPKNEANALAWNDFKYSFKQWADGEREDLMEIAESLIDHIKKGLEELSPKIVQKIRDLVDKILIHAVPTTKGSVGVTRSGF